MSTPAPIAKFSVIAWDVPTRLFHWTLLTLVVSAWISFEYAEAIDDELLVWHTWNGIAVIVLLVWRLVWGVLGSSTARFAAFVPTPRAAWRHAQATLNGTAARYLGHNPLGSLMVIGLMVVLLTQATLGLFAVDDNDLTGGPLHRLVTEAQAKEATRRHDFIFHYILLPLVGLHIAANLFYSFCKKEPLIAAMVTGKKPAEIYADAPSALLVDRPLWRALACLVTAAACVIGALVAVGGRL